MARINPQLLDRIKSKLGLSQSRVYGLIDQKVRSAHLPRSLAAIAVAAERGINISKFASAADLASIRQSAITAAPTVVLPIAQAEKTKGSKRLKGKKGPEKRRGNTVFVVHGRDLPARDAIFSFLRSIGLKPLEWTQALKLTKKSSPYVGEVLDAAFSEAAAIVVLLTPDDEARLHESFHAAHDPAYEKTLTGQARPNVLFEAGMAFGRNPHSTVIVQLGETRPFSDIGGRHVLYLSNQASSRQEFTTKLANAGCNVDTTGTDWLSAGNFQGRSIMPKSASRRGRR